MDTRKRITSATYRDAINKILTENKSIDRETAKLAFKNRFPFIRVVG